MSAPAYVTAELEKVFSPEVLAEAREQHALLTARAGIPV